MRPVCLHAVCELGLVVGTAGGLAAEGRRVEAGGATDVGEGRTEEGRPGLQLPTADVRPSARP